MRTQGGAVGMGSEWEAVTALARLGTEPLPAQEIARRALVLVAEATGADGGELSAWLGGERQRLYAYWPGQPEGLASPPPAADPGLQPLVDSGQPVRWTAELAPPALRSVCEALGCVCGASVVVRSGGRPIAVIDVAARAADAFDEAALERLDLVAALLGPLLDLAINAMRGMQAETAQSVLELRTLQRVAEMVSRSLDLDEVLGRCLDLAMQVARAPAGVIYLYDARRVTLRRVVQRNVPEAVAPPEMPGEGVSDRFAKGPALVVNLDDSAGDHDALAAARRHGFRRLVILPLKAEDKLVGLLGLHFFEPMMFAPSTVLTLEAIAGQEAIAIENARAHRTSELRAHLATMLREFGERALMPGDERDLYALVLETALKIARADRGLVSRISGDRARVIAAAGKEERLIGVELPLDVPYFVPVLASQGLFIVEDVDGVDAHTVVGQVAGQNKTASFVLQMMRHRGRPLGHIFVGSGEMRRYEPEEIEALGLLANMGAEVLERAYSHKAVEAQRQRLGATLEHLPVAVAVIGFDGQILHLNHAGREFGIRFTGHVFTGADDRDWRHALSTLRFLYPDGRPIPLDDLLTVRAFRGETPPPREQVVESPDGQQRMTLLAVAAPIQRDEEGNVIAIVSGWQDITPIRELADAKDRFLRIASHELRSPITSLRATISLLEMDPNAILDEARRNVMLQRIQRQIDRLIRLVEQLIDSARLNAQEVPLQLAECDLASVAREAIEMARSDMADRVVRLESQGPQLGQWDALRLEQVVTNLVRNALRYSGPDKEVVVRLSGDQDTARLDVIDYGIGIAPEQQEKIFSPFYRGANAAQQVKGGLGLGLHIASELVRRHGGTIRVTSAPGQGATFTVELPRRRA